MMNWFTMALSRPQRLLIAYLLLLVVSISLTATIFFLLNPVPSKELTVLDQQSLEYRFSVQDTLGVNLDNDVLQFGGGPPGATLQRGINISSGHMGLLIISWSGNGSLVSSANEIPVEPGVPLEINFSLSIPLQYEPGNYTGTVFFTIHESEVLS